MCMYRPYIYCIIQYIYIYPISRLGYLSPGQLHNPLHDHASATSINVGFGSGIETSRGGVAMA